MKSFIFVLIASLATLLTGCATTISGKVVSEDGARLAETGGKINLVRIAGDAATPKSIVLDLDASGHFKTDQDIAKGEYLIEPIVPNYKGGSQTIVIDGDRNLTLTVTPMTKPKTKTIGANVDIEFGRGSGETTLTPPQL